MTVEWSDAAKRDLRRLDAAVAERIIRAVVRFAGTGHGDIRTLRGSDEHRLRIGDWRVRCYVSPGVLTVLRVLHRREAYR